MSRPMQKKLMVLACRRGGGGGISVAKIHYFEHILSNWGLIALSPKYGPHLGIHNNSSQFKNLGKCRRLQYIMCIVFHLTEGKFLRRKRRKGELGPRRRGF